MKRTLLAALLAITLLLTACSNPVPESKLDYVGEWRAPHMYLLITADGSVAYKRLKNGANISVNGPLQKFVGNDFIVGVAFVTTTFTVSTPPHQNPDNSWTMVVDGVELTRPRKL